MTLIYCGRFQPFHNGHLTTLRSAATLDGRLVVGVVFSALSPEHTPSDEFTAMGDARLSASLNPFSVIDRLTMISATVRSHHLADRTTVMPMPRPDVYWELVTAMLPGPRTWILPIGDDPFNQVKERFFVGRGDRVVRVQGDPTVCGTQVRKALAEDPRVAVTLVPAPVASWLGLGASATEPAGTA